MFGDGVPSGMHIQALREGMDSLASNLIDLQVELQAETRRRLEAEQRLHRVVFAVSGEALVGEEIDEWVETTLRRKRPVVSLDSAQDS